MSLTANRRKRNFSKTAEPSPEAGSVDRRGTVKRFVIQKHAASRLHYDLRLEMGGAFKSWAVPKGVPLKKGEKRLAMHVEDHPLAYGDFEGTISKGEYGGGTVLLWDRGDFVPAGPHPLKDYKAGKLHFTLIGQKLSGEWHLVRLREGEGWLLIKGGEDMKPISAKSDDTSVISGKNMKELSEGASPAWISDRSKKKRRTVLSMPVFVEPMKARLVSDPPKGEWHYEMKFDGWRALALKGGQGVQLLSRNNKGFTDKFPDIVQAVGALPVERAVIDGEIAAIDPEGRSSFQLLQAYDTGSERPPLLYYAFDLLELEGRDLTGLPLTERRELLLSLIPPQDSVIRFSVTLGTDGPRLLKEASKLGLEGLIGKQPHSQYEVGSRSGAWIKLKLHQEQEFVIGGYTPPEGSRKFFGSLIVGVRDGKKLVAAGKVGTGFDHALLKSLHARFRKLERKECPFANLPAATAGKWGQGITASEMKRCHWLDPVLVCQVKFSEWTRDGRLRQPVFLGLREDKNPADVVRERPS
jgi:bifunctional non-homologous end joining protein LigD